MSTTWNTKYGPRRVRHDPPTLEEAIFAARGIRGITVIPPGNEAAMLAGLPINLLPGSADTAGLLDAWGIRTLGELAAGHFVQHGGTRVRSFEFRVQQRVGVLPGSRGLQPA